MIRKIIRKILRIRKSETIADGINRHFIKIKSIFDSRQVSLEEISQVFDNLGVKNGDTIIVHSSWRGLYALKASPQEVINLLIEKVGKDGTIIMPSSTNNKLFLDVKESRSFSGVLSEVFRNYPDVERSEFPDSPMIGLGKNANNILKYHVNSRYTFDYSSPYFLSMNDYNAKVLLLGMGKKPHKISVFHLATYNNRNHENYKNVFKKNMRATVIGKNEKSVEINFVDRLDNFTNNKHKFRNLFKQVTKKQINYKGISVISFNSNDAYNLANEYCSKGGLLYKDKSKRKL